MTKERIKKALKFAEFCDRTGYAVTRENGADGNFDNFMADYRSAKASAARLAMSFEDFQEQNPKGFAILKVEVADDVKTRRAAEGKPPMGRPSKKVEGAE